MTARRTRLVRVPDLHVFRCVIAALCPSAGLVVVPSRSAARQLRRTLGAPSAASDLVTREELYDRLHARLPRALARLTTFARDALAQAAAADAARAVPGLPFRLRPGLVGEMLRFYDQLRRQSQKVERFEELIEEALGGRSAPSDRGAERLMLQTRFLARTFQEYERRVAACGACDEHTLRDLLIVEPASTPIRHIVVTVPDWIADPDGLFVADFDLLARMPGLEAIDIVSTEAMLGSGFHHRLHNWWPGLEEAEAGTIGSLTPRVRPVLLAPGDAPADRAWFTYRDREEELVAIARRIKADRRRAVDLSALGRTAVVFKRPLPYIYLAPETFGACGIPWRTSDALPLAAEPTAAAIDLVLELAGTNFVRGAIVALLRSPHFRWLGGSREELSREAVNALDRVLSDERYLGGCQGLEELSSGASRLAEVVLGRSGRPTGKRPGTGASAAMPALEAALAISRELMPLLEPAPASRQLRLVLSFLSGHLRPIEAGDPRASRECRARATVIQLLNELADAHERHHDPRWTIDDLAVAVRRWVEDETFAPVDDVESDAAGLHLLDDQAARYGEFDDIALVGLVEHEWPEQSRPNIFYSLGMLKALGWPSEKDRRAAADARFLDLLASPSRQVTVSTFTLDDDALVMRSPQLDEIPRAGLSIAPGLDEQERIFPDEALADGAPALEELGDMVRGWAGMRIARPSSGAREFHGAIGPQPPRPWSVSALETYLGCPFRFFAQHVLSLEEEPDDEEVMDPRRQGQLVHQVFEEFFKEWQSGGRGAITPENLDEARAIFEHVVDGSLQHLPPGEAGLERTRLLGSPAAAGLGEAVFRMEAERPVAVVERLLEHRLKGRYAIATSSGPRKIELHGKADRMDLLEDGTFRVIDYKLGWPPNRARALQLPIYGLCAEQQLANHRGRSWTLGEAVYLAFKGPKRVVPLFPSPSDREKVLRDAQQRLADTIDAIERGDFPPTPDDVYRCDTCSYAPVCRKDYVGDVV
jgi:RecB family exonuclease